MNLMVKVVVLSTITTQKWWCPSTTVTIGNYAYGRQREADVLRCWHIAKTKKYWVHAGVAEWMVNNSGQFIIDRRKSRHWKYADRNWDSCQKWCRGAWRGLLEEQMKRQTRSKLDCKAISVVGLVLKQIDSVSLGFRTRPFWRNQLWREKNRPLGTAKAARNRCKGKEEKNLCILHIAVDWYWEMILLKQF